MARDDGRKRVAIDYVGPQIDGGQFPIKRSVGEIVKVVTHAFADGHDRIRVELLHRKQEREEWSIVDMTHGLADEWSASFAVAELGAYVYTVRGWVDHFITWQSDLQKRLQAAQDVTVDLRIGAGLLRDAAQRAEVADAAKLSAWAEFLETPADLRRAVEISLSDELTDVMHRCPDRSLTTTCPRTLTVVVDRPKAVYSTRYELFPRSAVKTAQQPHVEGRHGTFRDCESMLSGIARMGFDVLYLPPIHPIGKTHRKGRNNSVSAGSSDPGSPWAIGSSHGGHKAVHPELGTLEDFTRLIGKAAEHGLEIAMDLAFQRSPDHPYVSEHPE